MRVAVKACVLAGNPLSKKAQLIVWGIQEGRAVAVDVDVALTKTSSRLPWAGSISRRDLNPAHVRTRPFEIEASA